MAKQKYYAVKSGRQTGIFLSWSECQKQTVGFSNAVFKSFLSRSEAEAYLSDKQNDLFAADEAEIVAYVDGSYRNDTKEFSYGAVIFADGNKLAELSEKYNDAELAAMRNVAGEIKGAEAVMRYCCENGHHSLAIYYDYAGIEKWCTGEWKTNKDGTKRYKAFYDSIKDTLQIKFVKVAAHTGNTYNEIVDKLAKAALGIR